MKEKKVSRCEEVHKPIEQIKRLPQLQSDDLKCVFCGESNQKVEGGYFKQKFLCRKCDREKMEIDSFLYQEALNQKLRLLK